jgi:predicted nucleic acid-binding protein
MIVLDASVVIKWFLQESDSEKALQFKEELLRGKVDIIVPDLVLYEILNVLRFKSGVTEAAVKTILPAFFDLGVEIITPSQRLLEETLHLSFVTELSVYDCVYLALANELGAKLVTADKRLVRQAAPLAKVELLN